MTLDLDRQLSNRPQRARHDLMASWDHLWSAAEHGARHVGQRSRRRARLARDRAEAVRLAMLGERPPSPWRWLGAGLAAGVAFGAAGATVLVRVRARRDAQQTVTDEATATVPVATAKIQNRAGAGAEAVRERARTAVQRAATSARGVAVEFRDRLTQPDSDGEPEPADPAGTPSETVSGR